LLAEDKFQLNNIEHIFAQIKSVFTFNEEYFHIYPQILLQYFYENTLLKEISLLEVEHKLMDITKQLSDKTA